MANKKYNLSMGVAEKFEFVLTDPKSGKDVAYEMRYPSAADFEPSKEYDRQISELEAKMAGETVTDSQKKAFQSEIEDLEKEKAALFYKLVTPIDHEVSIEDVLNRVNVIVVRNFNKMISTELGSA